MKTAIACCALLLCGSTSFAANLPSWDKMPPTMREIVVKLYVGGYLAGINQGVGEGIKSAISYTKTTGNNTYIDDKTNIFTSCSNILSNNVDRIYDETRSWQQIQIKDTNFYVGEITAFLKKYPPCAKMDAGDLVEVMTPVWFNLVIDPGYENIGKGCSK